MAHDRSTNHGFPLLQQGEEIDNWGNVVRTEAFVPLEERLMVVDTSANRSNYTPYTDLLYYETDTGAFYEGNGEASGWSETELESRISALENGGDVTTLTPLEAVSAPTASGTDALAIGVAQDFNNDSASAQGANDIAIGNGATATLGGATSIGISSSAADGSVGIGRGAAASQKRTVAIGYGSSSGSQDAIAVGNGATGGGRRSTALGNDTTASGETATAVGGGTSATADFTSAVGDGASASNQNEGVFGNSGSFSTNNWIVPGDFTVNGSKNFEISDPSRPDTHDLRHGNYEGDVAGGLVYRREVSITVDGDTGTATITMPDWFGPLATNVDVVVQAQGHFGDAYAERDEPTGETITVTANASGDYKLIIFATRDDANVPDPATHDVTKPKGRRWNGEPRAYYRDAPDIDPTNFDGIGRVEQFFDHTEECDPTPCPTAFEKWRVTSDDGERVDVDEPMDATAQTVVDSARDELEGN